jgi:hypothetical protein
LQAIMTNTFISWCRRRRHAPLPAGTDPDGWARDRTWPGNPAQGRSAEDQLLRHMIHPDIVAAMRALPDRHRVTVYLADVEELRLREISAVTGIPTGSIKSCLYRGRGQLRTQLASHAPAHRPPADRPSQQGNRPVTAMSWSGFWLPAWHCGRCVLSAGRLPPAPSPADRADPAMTTLQP